MTSWRPSAIRWTETLIPAAALLLAVSPVRALEVTAPGQAGASVMEGVDYASRVLGNRWDFDGPEDLALHLSNDLTAISFDDGVFSATSTDTDPYFYLIDPGVVSAVQIEAGDLYPIDPRRFSRLTLKFRHDSNEDAKLTALWNDECRCFQPNQFGRTTVTRVPAGAWQIVDLDLPALTQVGPPWASFDDLQSLRLDPFRIPGPRFDLDWLRLTGEADGPVPYEVRWQTDDPGFGGFTIAAVDEDGALFTLATAVPTTARAWTVDLSPLAPGAYRLRVIDGYGIAADSQGFLTVTEAPVLAFDAPHRRGDLDRDYALIASGNPWGPLDPQDVQLLLNFAAPSYAGGILTATSTNDDPGVRFFIPEGIDSDRYHQLSFIMELSPPVLLENGQGVARMVYGATTSAADADPTEDIVLREGRIEYILGDMREIPLEGERSSQWNGEVKLLRLDPHESPLAKTVTVEALRVAPWHRANPAMTFAWTVTDGDSSSVQTCLFLDPDDDPDNGNELPIQPCHDAPPGPTSRRYDLSGQAQPGLYHVLGIVSDGLNETRRYAGGRLEVLDTDNDGLFASSFERDEAR